MESPKIIRQNNTSKAPAVRWTIFARLLTTLRKGCGDGNRLAIDVYHLGLERIGGDWETEGADDMIGLKLLKILN
jgi:hypothetical protein